MNPRWQRIEPAMDLLVCPHCYHPLNRVGSRLLCPQSHSFDIARQGYVNLLGKAAPANADSSAMIQSRASFLEAGHYRPLVDHAYTMISPHSPIYSIADLGAGSGYYLSSLIDRLHPSRHLASDISPAAARYCASCGLASIVADSWQRLPIADHCIDLALSCFAPRQMSQFHRIIRPSGYLLIICPGKDHLASLRKSFDLLSIFDDKIPSILTQARQAGFNLIDRDDLSFTITLNFNELSSLIAMGPNAFHSQRYNSTLQSHENDEEFTTQVQGIFLLFQSK